MERRDIYSILSSARSMDMHFHPHPRPWLGSSLHRAAPLALPLDRFFFLSNHHDCPRRIHSAIWTESGDSGQWLTERNVTERGDSWFAPSGGPPVQDSGAEDALTRPSSRFFACPLYITLRARPRVSRQVRKRGKHGARPRPRSRTGTARTGIGTASARARPGGSDQ